MHAEKEPPPRRIVDSCPKSIDICRRTCPDCREGWCWLLCSHETPHMCDTCGITSIETTEHWEPHFEYPQVRTDEVLARHLQENVPEDRKNIQKMLGDRVWPVRAKPLRNADSSSIPIGPAALFKALHASLPCWPGMGAGVYP